MELLAIDDFIFSDHGISPAMVTNKSSYLGMGVDRRSGMSSSIFFGASPQPATWNVIVKLPTYEARDALITVLSSQRRSEFRLLAQQEAFGVDLCSIEASIADIDQRTELSFVLTFESNDSVWLAEDVDSVSKTFSSPLDQVLPLPVRGNLLTSPIVRITPSVQRSATTEFVGWKYRTRFAISNEGDEPLFRYPVRLPLGSTSALVSGSKALASGADVRVWLQGIEQSRYLVTWNSSASYVWVIVPALPPGQSLTYEVVYGNPNATDASLVELIYPDKPAFDLDASSNYLWVYRTAKDIANAGEGLWYLTSPLEGGSADYGVPGAWQTALTFENPNNTDEYVQPRAQRVAEGSQQWYQARLYAARWRGPGFDDFAEYVGTNPADGVTIHNPFGVRSVHAEDIIRRNDGFVKTVVTTTVGSETASDEVLTPHDPYTRAVVIGRNSGGEGWHVLSEYGGTIGAPGGRLYLPSSGAPPITPAISSGWEVVPTLVIARVLATRNQQFTSRGTVPLGATATTGQDALARQFVYPLPEGTVFTTSDTVKGQILAAQTNAGGDFRMQTRVLVMTAASVVRAVLVDFDTGALFSEFYPNTSALQNRHMFRGGAVNLQANYTSVIGDYLIIEIGVRSGNASGYQAQLPIGDPNDDWLPEDETTIVLTSAINTSPNPWIEFSIDLSPGEGAPFDADWVPSSPLKHFGIAVWPFGGGEIPQDAESKVSIEADGDVSVHIAAEPLYITPLELEEEIYELATELRVHGGANAVAPYDSLVIGNARQDEGPGTPRASLILNAQGLQVDTERRTHTLWEPDFILQEEILSAHTVRSYSGILREIDATDVAAMERIAVTVPNPNFTTNTSGWESHLGQGSWTVIIARDAAVGGAAVGSLSFKLTPAGAGSIYYRNSTYFPIEPLDTVELTAWFRQADIGTAWGRIGIAWYNVSNTLISESFDQLYGVDLPVANDHQLIVSAVAPAGATSFRILIGVTVDATGPTQKWFDDIAATIIRPLRYSGASPKVTDEVRSSQWLPLSPIQRQVANGTFDVDISSWELLDDGTGITYTASHDGTLGGDQDGALKIAITANSGSDSVIYGNSRYYDLNGQERIEVSAWVRTSNANLHPRLMLFWYTKDDDDPIGFSLEDSWAANPTINTGYNRAFAGIAPPGASRFRVAVAADAIVSTTLGNVWFDDIEINGNALVVTDIAMGTLDVTAQVRPRWVP